MMIFAFSANLEARRVAAVAQRGRARCRDGTAHSPEPHDKVTITGFWAEDVTIGGAEEEDGLQFLGVTDQ